MALLGTLIDKITASIGAGSWAAQTYGTLQHSLPGLGPDFVVMQVLSVGAATCAPCPLSVGGNASIATFGMAGGIGNGASQPIVGFDCIIVRVHTQVR